MPTSPQAPLGPQFRKVLYCRLLAAAEQSEGVFVDARAQVEPGVGAPEAMPSQNRMLGEDGTPMALGITGSQLVLSANERAVFSVGGQRSGEAGAEPAGVLRLSTLQQDFADPVWEPVAFELDFGRMPEPAPAPNLSLGRCLQ